MRGHALLANEYYDSLHEKGARSTRIGQADATPGGGELRESTGESAMVLNDMAALQEAWLYRQRSDQYGSA